MLYYRYRPMTSLTVKELIYDELYFSYPRELNDPLDGLVEYKFHEDFPRWKNLLDFAWEKFEIDTKSIAEAFAKKSPISVKEFCTSDIFIIQTIASTLKPSNIRIVFELASELVNCINRYLPGEGCSVSFSRIYDNSLMWSHYTGKHEGFCLIFRGVNGCINQDPERTKTIVKTKEHFSLCIEQGFKIQDITYDSNKNDIDGFTLFPASVYGRNFNEFERENYLESIERAYLKKTECWEYEKESRLYLPAGSPLTGDKVISPFSRIFHYDSSQISGVIFGMRMKEADKSLIREILLKKSEDRYKTTRDEKFIFDIVAFDASFNGAAHQISTTPIEIYSCGELITNTQSDFEKKLKSWRRAEAFKINNTKKGISSKRIIMD